MDISSLCQVLVQIHLPAELSAQGLWNTPPLFCPCALTPLTAILVGLKFSQSCTEQYLCPWIHTASPILLHFRADRVQSAAYKQDIDTHWERVISQQDVHQPVRCRLCALWPS